MAINTSSGLGESGYRPITLTKTRTYTKKRVLLRWDDHEIGQRAKMIAHALYEALLGKDMMEIERKFGKKLSELALDVILKAVPGFTEWFIQHGDGRSPTELDPKPKMRRAAYLLYQRVWNSVYNQQGKKEDGSRAARSREHYMHPSKTYLRQWEIWARQMVQIHHYGFKVISNGPRNEKVRFK